MVQESFPRLKRRLYRPPFAPRIGLCKIYAVLSYHLCVPIRDALCACAALAGREKTSASTVRRDVGIAPYGYFEGWCRRADVGSGPYGAFNGRCA